MTGKRMVVPLRPAFLLPLVIVLIFAYSLSGTDWKVSRAGLWASLFDGEGTRHSAAASSSVRPVVAHIAVSRLTLDSNLVLPIWRNLETDFLHTAILESPVKTGAFEILERTSFDHLLAEQKLIRDQLTDPTRASELGKVWGVGFLVEGEIKSVELASSDAPIPYSRQQRIAGRIVVAYRQEGSNDGTHG